MGLLYAHEKPCPIFGSTALKASEMKPRNGEKESEDHQVRKERIRKNCGSNIKMHEPVFLGSKITADGGCSHEIKKHLLLGRKAMTNLDSILKSRDITLSVKVCMVKTMVFPVVMCGCECWTIKKAEHRRIDAFELWCWRRCSSIPWTARR